VKATVKDVIRAMDVLAPLSLSKDWDNSGLQVGHPDWPVGKILVALDPVLEVVEFACENHVDMLVTHHPLFFTPLRSIRTDTPEGKMIQAALSHPLAVFSAHTNLDMAQNGVNDILAQKIGLKEIAPLFPKEQAVFDGNSKGRYSFGRIGFLGEEINLSGFAEIVKQRLSLESIRVAGNPRLKVTKAATCCGSGSGMMELFFSSGAQVFISGDLKYHDARDAEAMGLGLMDIGHFASEHIMIDALVSSLSEQLDGQGFEVEVFACDVEKEPFRVC